MSRSQNLSQNLKDVIQQFDSHSMPRYPCVIRMENLQRTSWILQSPRTRFHAHNQKVNRKFYEFHFIRVVPRVAMKCLLLVSFRENSIFRSLKLIYSVDTSYPPYGQGLDRRKKEPSISLKINSKHHQVISSKFPKSFTGGSDLVVFYDFSKFSGFIDFQKLTKHHKVTSTLKLF